MTAGGRHVAVAGGGLAGMSAAVALAERGFRVTLLEKRPMLGGRAGSYLDATSGELVDNCQHVLMPCCTNLLDFYARVGVRDRIRFYSEIPFIDARGRVSGLRSSRLPAPLHAAPSFLRLSFLSLGDKLRVARGLAALLALRPDPPPTTALEWFRARGQSEATLRNFWELVLTSALNETLERAGVRYAAKVFLDAFLSNPLGYRLGVPTVPLGALYGEPVVRHLEARGGEVRLRTEVRGLRIESGGARELELGTGERLAADDFVLAFDWEATARLVAEHLPALAARLRSAFVPSPITGVHLWFDRPVTSLAFAALPGRQVHWFFNKTHNFAAAGGEQYLQLVTSASRAWLPLGKGEILEVALGELAGALPAVRGARLLKATVLKEPFATFAPTEEAEGARPQPATAIEGLFLAGDWVATGWPATMESAVRGGYLAAEAVAAAAGRPERILVPDLPATGLMRLRRTRRA